MNVHGRVEAASTPGKALWEMFSEPISRLSGIDLSYASSFSSKSRFRGLRLRQVSVGAEVDSCCGSSGCGRLLGCLNGTGF